MTVTKCFLERSSLRYTFGVKQTASIQAIWRIETDDPGQYGVSVHDEAQIFVDTVPGTCFQKLPTEWEYYDLTVALGAKEIDQSLFVKRIDMQQDKQNLRLWHATVHWQPLGTGDQPGDVQPQPQLRPAIAWFESQVDTEQTDVAYNQIELPAVGRGTARAVDTLGPIENAARQAFDSPLFSNRRMTTLVLQKNYVDGGFAAALNNLYDSTLNSVPFLTDIPRHCARYDGAVTSQPIQERTYKFYKTTIRISFRRDPFYIKLANKGLMAWDGTAVTAIQVKDEGGEDMDAVEPMPLALDGRLATAASTEIPYRVQGEQTYVVFEQLAQEAGIYTPPPP